MIQTAGHDRAVDQHADLILEPVAKAALPVIRFRQRWPDKGLAIGQKDVFSELFSTAAVRPVAGKGRLQRPHDLAVFLVFSGFISKYVFPQIQQNGEYRKAHSYGYG